MARISKLIENATVSARVLAGSGILRPYPPAVLTRMLATLRRWGTSPAGGFGALALRSPDGVGIVDERGEVTWGELHARTNALAHALRSAGIASGDAVALLCRNHRGFVETSLAASKLGADVVFLNTSFAGPQLLEVLARERVSAVVHDEEFADLLAAAPVAHRFLAWVDEPGAARAVPTLEELIAAHPASELAPPPREGRTIILTSGTTGTPKGAPRPQGGISAAVSLLSRMPLRAGWRCFIAAPLFHTWGFAHVQLAMLLGTTMVLRRRFDPAEALGVLADQRCDSFVVVPVMLQRILALTPHEVDAARLDDLKVVASSGSALPGDFALAWMDAFGENLYSTYGSTEVAWASVADPDDLRRAPTSAGRVPHATVVRILDPLGREVPVGRSGRVFVGNSLQIEGYTTGGTKEIVDGLMSSGDIGRFGPDGRLYLQGRDDEMVVSGGENVFPQEVEDCLARHDAVEEAAVVGVDDDEFGRRLRAYVVIRRERDADEDQLKAWVRSHLARYKVPREIRFLEGLPRNATGKVLKRHLDAR